MCFYSIVSILFIEYIICLCIQQYIVTVSEIILFAIFKHITIKQLRLLLKFMNLTYPEI